MRTQISLAFEKAKKENRPALLIYTVAGDNTKKKCIEILNSISTNAWLNILFFIIFIVFAFSFCAFWSIGADRSDELVREGYLSVFRGKRDRSVNLGHVSICFCFCLP